jgi:hypothetical protein
MGLFDGLFGSSNSTSSNAADQRQISGDAGINLREGGAVGGAGTTGIGGTGANAAIATGGGRVAGVNADYTESGGFNVRSGNVAGPGGILLQGGSKLEISSDPQVIMAALKAVTSQASNVTASMTGTLTDLFNTDLQAQQQQADLQSQALDKFVTALTPLAQNQQTGGASDVNKTVLYVALALLAVVAVLFWRHS